MVLYSHFFGLFDNHKPNAQLPPNDTVPSEPSNPQTHSATDYLTAHNAGYSIALLAAIYGLKKSLPYLKKALRARGFMRNEENADYAAIDGAKLLS